MLSCQANLLKNMYFECKIPKVQKPSNVIHKYMSTYELGYNPTTADVLWAIGLSGIKRYIPKDGEKVPEMIHRTDNFIHVRRVMYLGEYLINILEQNPLSLFKPDFKKTQDMGRHHDDSEIANDDILASEKKRMTKMQLQELEEKDDLAAHAVAHLILGLKPPLDQFYIDRQREQRNKITLESQIVDVADKWDSACEMMHEVRCGNKPFSELLAAKIQTFDSFSKYPFFETIKNNSLLEFDKIPTPQEAINLPTISIDDIKEPADVSKFMSLEKTKDWPACYRAWSDLSKNIFNLHPEKFIFPGWYMQLWSRWNYFPKTTTASGLWTK
jgi:hypothetical protein